MLNKVKEYINSYNMLIAGDRVVIGLSGGADSVALLHALKELKPDIGIEIFAAHIHHGLRGEAADADFEFSKDLCMQWGIPFYFKKADIRALSIALKRSEEETGRLVRYEFFNQVLAEVKGTKIATAHHKNDQAETILHHLIRGSGMKGLSGISPIRDEVLIRPLLDVSRSEIECYIREKNLSYKVDSTNTDSVYTRNRIRNELIPMIEKAFNSNIVDSLAKLGNIIRDDDSFINGYCNHEYLKSVKRTEGNIELPLDKLLQEHPAVVKRLVRQALLELKGDLDGIGYDNIDDIIILMKKSQTGSMLNLPGGIIAAKDYNYMRFSLVDSKKTKTAPFDFSLEVPGAVFLSGSGITITAENVTGNGKLSFGSRWVYINKAAIKGGLRVRQRQDGDRFKPFGLKGIKKLKDYFIDVKVPREDRDSIPLVVDEDNIIWVAGYQLNDDYKISSETKDIIKLSLQTNEKYGG